MPNSGFTEDLPVSAPSAVMPNTVPTLAEKTSTHPEGKFFSHPEDFPLEVWSHEGFSFDCTGSIWDPIARYVFMQGPVKGGTSGGPILTKSGHLLSIVSNSSNARGCEVESDEDQIGRNPILWKCLPEFIREQLE